MSDDDEKKRDRDGHAAPIDPAYLREIAMLVNETGMAEIEVKYGAVKIRVARFAQTVAAAAAAPTTINAAPATPVPASAPAPADAANHPHALKSPMVGTVYRRPSPDTKAFVEIGSVVKAGDRVLLIEAMKTFNDIPAHRDGVVTAILVDDGHPVEFGEALLVIE